MKVILMIDNMNTEEDKKKIMRALDLTRVAYEVNVDKKIVVVHGDNDMAAVARKTLQDLSYIIL